MAKGRRPNRLLTDALREIRNTRSRFFSLMILSALAVCFLAGLRATAPDMKISADRYLDGQKLMDLRVVSTLGLTEEDVAALADQPGVALVQGAYSVDAIAKIQDKDSVVKVISLTDEVNLPRMVEGRMPGNAQECLVEPRYLQENGLSIGDKITLDTGTGTYEDALRHETYTIVGTADSPLYIGVERGSSTLGTGKVAFYVMLPEEAFDMEAYTDAYLLADGALELPTYSQEYEDLIDSLADALDPMAQERAQLRGDSVREEAQEEIDKAQKELDEGKAEAEQELSDARAELEDGRRELDEGWADYLEGQRELRDQVAEAEQEIADGQVELQDALKELEDGKIELQDARTELDDGWQEYHDGYGDYLEGLRQYYEAEEELEEGRQAYEDGLKEYEDGLKEYEDGRASLSSASGKLMDAEEQYQAGKDKFDLLLDQIVQAMAQGGVSLYPDGDALLAALTSQDPAQAGMAQAAVDQVLSGMRGQLLAGMAQADEQIASLNETIAQLEAAIDAMENPPVDPDPEPEPEPEPAPDQGETPAPRTAEDPDPVDPGFDGPSLEELKAQLAQAQEGLAAAQAAKAELESQLSLLPQDSQAVLANAQLLDSSLKQIQDGWDEVHDGYDQLREAKEQLDDAAKTLEETKQKLEDGQKELDDGWAELEDGRLELEDALKELNDGEAEYADGQKDWQEGWQEYQDGVQELEDAKVTLAQESADGERELADALQELNDGEADYAQGYQDYLDGEREAQEEIADGEKKLEQARRDLAQLDESEWYLLDRGTNMGYASYEMDADRMGNLASVFPLIFFLVAALVCLTTMTRMVEEQRVTIGGLKALGYSKGAIAMKYVGYGFLASAIGSLLGLAVGLTLLPWIICNAWAIIYTLGDIHYSLEPVTSVVAYLAAVGTVTLSALAACISTLTAVPAQLMRPKAPPMGKRILLERITPLWRLLSFNYKITLRNLFRYQKRFWMTVIGIGGCAALIVTAFGLRDSIFSVMDMQYDEIYRYTAQLGLVDNITPGEWQEVEQALNESGLVEDWTAEHTETVTAQTDAYAVDCTLEVVDSGETLSRFVNLRHRQDHSPVALGDDGVILTEKLAKLLGVQAGDTITLDGDSRVEVTVADVTEHYIQHYVYMTSACYQQLFGETPQENAVLVDYSTQDAESQQLESDLMALDGITSLTRIVDTRTTFTSSMESVDYAVVLIIVCAAALAFVVLYNLTNINITERVRELATLKVLGLYDGELSAYIYRENVILTVFGVALGMVLGKLLHQWLILTVEIDLLMFGRVISLPSYLYAVVLTTIFSLVVNLAAHRKLKKLDMVESLKTVE